MGLVASGSSTAPIAGLPVVVKTTYTDADERFVQNQRRGSQFNQTYPSDSIGFPLITHSCTTRVAAAELVQGSARLACRHALAVLGNLFVFATRVLNFNTTHELHFPTAPNVCPLSPRRTPA
jgi:hypothetical protein